MYPPLLQVNKHGVLSPVRGVKVIIPKITPDKAVDEWGRIESVVQDFAKAYPQEMMEILAAVKTMRHEIKKDSGAATGGLKHASFRIGIMLPQRLDMILKRYFPDLLTDKKKRRKFMRKFPGFTVPSKI